MGMKKHPTSVNFAFLVLLAALLAPVSAGRAEEFGDIVVAPGAIYSGNTFHGYAEMRVALENRSISRTHNVTLVFPNRAWNNGNSIDRLSRTVTLAPGARAIVPLLQPPLPANGDNSIRVEVDNREAGTVRAPNANNHMSRYNRGGPPVVFISRSLDSEAVERIFNANRGGFTAAMATGAPDANSRGGYQTKTWMPDTREYGKTNWLELDYTPPLAADKISIYQTMSLPTDGEILLTGVSGNQSGPVAHVGWKIDSGRGAIDGVFVRLDRGTGEDGAAKFRENKPLQHRH